MTHIVYNSAKMAIGILPVDVENIVCKICNF